MCKRHGYNSTADARRSSHPIRHNLSLSIILSFFLSFIYLPRQGVAPEYIKSKESKYTS